MTRKTLTVSDHDRSAADMTYVYPVLSRRAGGVSIGINLNPNNACNWRCVYCQVPNLTLGKGPRIELAQLESELRRLLDEIVNGDYLAQAAPGATLKDLAFSGNGEPTSSPDFAEAVATVARVLAHFELVGRLNVVLITNGSLVEREAVQRGLDILRELGGEVWFKLDSATDAGAQVLNRGGYPVARQLDRLRHVANTCPTWVQTCMVARNGKAPSEEEVEAYLSALSGLRNAGVPLRGILLYTLARPSLQPEASQLGALPETWLTELAQRIEAVGFRVNVAP